MASRDYSCPKSSWPVLKNAYDSLEKQLRDMTPREERLSILRKMRMVISDIDRELRRIKHLLLQEQDFRAVIEAGVSYNRISSFSQLLHRALTVCASSS